MNRSGVGSDSFPRTLSTSIFIGHGVSRPTPTAVAVAAIDPSATGQYGRT